MQKFTGKLIYLDTAPLIYFIEAHSKYAIPLEPIFEANQKGEFTFITSTLTITEVASGPLKKGRKDLADLFVNTLLNAMHFQLIDFNADIAIEAASIRSELNLKTPDAIHLATAVIGGAEFFFTNDRDFSRNEKISVITVDQIISSSF
ncbi:MAG: PIN domain-containing protein [Lewinella sp.]|nr:PIN domain-containing protein [Lewinella sp.]